MAQGQPIQYSDIISPDVQRQLDELNKTIKSLTSELDKLTKETTEQDKAAENYSETLRDEVEITEDLLQLTRQERELKDNVAKEQKRINEAKKKGVEIDDKALVSITKGKAAIAKHNQVLKNATKLTLAQKGSMTQLSLELGKNRMKYRELSKEQRNNAKVGGVLLKKIKSQDAAIKKLDASIGNNQRNVGNYSSALSGMGGQMGMVVSQIQNGITQLKLWKTAMVASTKATTGTSRALKIFKLALISTGVGALVVALGTLVTYLTSTASGTSKLAEKLAPLKAIMTTVTDLAKKFGEGVALILDGKFREGYKALGDAVKGVGKTYQEHIVINKTLAKLEEDLYQARMSSIVPIKEMEVEQRKLIAASKDSTKTEKERFEAARDALTLEAKISEERQKIRQLELDLLAKEAELSENSREENIELEEAKANLLGVIEEENKRLATLNANLETTARKYWKVKNGADELIKSLEALNSQEKANIDLTETSNQVQGETIILENRRVMSNDEMMVASEGLAKQRDKELRNEQEVQDALIAGGVAATNAAFSFAEQNKDMQTAQALINTFAGVGIALATPGNIYTNLATAATVLITGIANVAKIQQAPAYAEGTEFLEGDNTGVDKIHIRANYGERIVPTEINKMMGGIPNAQLPSLLMKGQMLESGLLAVAQASLQTQTEMNSNIQKFAYVDKQGNVHYINGNIKNYV